MEIVILLGWGAAALVGALAGILIRRIPRETTQAWRTARWTAWPPVAIYGALWLIAGSRDAGWMLFGYVVPVVMVIEVAARVARFRKG